MKRESKSLYFLLHFLMPLNDVTQNAPAALICLKTILTEILPFVNRK